MISEPFNHNTKPCISTKYQRICMATGLYEYLAVSTSLHKLNLMGESWSPAWRATSIKFRINLIKRFSKYPCPNVYIGSSIVYYFTNVGSLTITCYFNSLPLNVCISHRTQFFLDHDRYSRNPVTYYLSTSLFLKIMRLPLIIAIYQFTIICLWSTLV